MNDVSETESSCSEEQQGIDDSKSYLHSEKSTQLKESYQSGKPPAESKNKLCSRPKFLVLQDHRVKKRFQNKIAAKKSRERKKEILRKINNENFYLQQRVEQLECILENIVCPDCKKKIYVSLPNQDSSIVQTGLSSSTGLSSLKKSILLFSSSIILTILLLNIPSIFTYLTTKIHSPILRAMESTLREEDGLSNKRYRLTKRDLESLSLKVNGWFITIGDYYAITKQNKFLKKDRYGFNNEGLVRLLKEDEVWTYKNLTCVNCLVELNETNIVQEDLQFRLYLPINKFWDIQKINGETFSNINIEKEEFFYEINCLIIGASINSIKPDKKGREM